MLEPSMFDDRGRCVHHPHIRLRKKKLLGGWKIILVNCPDCCIENMLRMRESGVGRASRGSGKKSRGANASNSTPRSPGEDSNHKTPAQGNHLNHPYGRHPNQDSPSSSTNNSMPPISQLMIRTPSHYQGNNVDHNNSDDFSEASEITYGTRTNSHYEHPPSVNRGNGGIAGTVPRQQQQRYEQDIPPSNSGPHRVTRMPFTDAYGDKGWYTGEVASGSGLPHGQGSMHYCDGRIRGGWWSNGLAAGGGGGGNNNNGTPPKIRTPTVTNNTPARGVPSSNESIGSRNSHHRPQQYNNLPPPPPPRFNYMEDRPQWQ